MKWWWWYFAYEPDLPCPFAYIGPLLITWEWGYRERGRFPKNFYFSWFPD